MRLSVVLEMCPMMETSCRCSVPFYLVRTERRTLVMMPADRSSLCLVCEVVRVESKYAGVHVRCLCAHIYQGWITGWITAPHELVVLSVLKGQSLAEEFLNTPAKRLQISTQNVIKAGWSSWSGSTYSHRGLRPQALFLETALI